MPKIVILGSLKNGDYEVIAPKKVRADYHNEEGYQIACKRFYPAMDEADLVIVYGEPGEHTERDMLYAMGKNRRIVQIPLSKEGCKGCDKEDENTLLRENLSIASGFDQMNGEYYTKLRADLREWGTRCLTDSGLASKWHNEQFWKILGEETIAEKFLRKERESNQSQFISKEEK